jgi:hypothetical protein
VCVCFIRPPPPSSPTGSLSSFSRPFSALRSLHHRPPLSPPSTLNTSLLLVLLLLLLLISFLFPCTSARMRQVWCHQIKSDPHHSLSYRPERFRLIVPRSLSLSLSLALSLALSLSLRQWLQLSLCRHPNLIPTTAGGGQPAPACRSLSSKYKGNLSSGVFICARVLRCLRQCSVLGSPLSFRSLRFVLFVLHFFRLSVHPGRLNTHAPPWGGDAFVVWRWLCAP